VTARLGVFSRTGLLLRAVGIVSGYYVHRWVALWLGVFDGVPALVPDGWLGLLLRLAVAALLAGYVTSAIAAGSIRTARLLGIALAAIAILAALQRAEQGLPLFTRQVAQIVTAPLCAAGAALFVRHRRMWTG
jgi:hypothetical protein